MSKWVIGMQQLPELLSEISSPCPGWRSGILHLPLPCPHPRLVLWGAPSRNTGPADFVGGPLPVVQINFSNHIITYIVILNTIHFAWERWKCVKEKMIAWKQGIKSKPLNRNETICQVLHTDLCKFKWIQYLKFMNKF